MGCTYEYLVRYTVYISSHNCIIFGGCTIYIYILQTNFILGGISAITLKVKNHFRTAKKKQIYEHKSYRWVNIKHVDSRIVDYGYQWPKWLPSSQTHLYVIKRYFHGYLRLCIFSFKSKMRLNKHREIRSEIAYSVVWKLLSRQRG